MKAPALTEKPRKLPLLIGDKDPDTVARAECSCPGLWCATRVIIGHKREATTGESSTSHKAVGFRRQISHQGFESLVPAHVVLRAATLPTQLQGRFSTPAFRASELLLRARKYAPKRQGRQRKL